MAYFMLSITHSFDDVRLNSISFEQRSNFTKEHEVPSHPAFVIAVGTLDT